MSVAGITFKTARLRLTLTYLAIIMLLSVGFSVVFYYQSVGEARGNLENQRTQLDDFLFFTTPDRVSKIHNKQLSRFKQSLVKDLVAMNAGMLVVGTMFSAVLARRSLKPLEENVRAQTRFTSDAAHELRTPLTAMKTEIEVSLRDKKLTKADAVDVLKSNLEEVDKLDSLTNALLRLAKSDEMADRTYWDEYKVTDILNRSLGRLDVKAKKRFVKVKIPNSNATITGDADQLVELFVTLFGNAIKYSHKNSEVEVKIKSDEDNLKISIIDKGVGISDEDKPYIFDRFYRADASRNKTKAEGYGLGLSLAQAIVLAHSGKIEVKSTYGKGSTFTVYIPA